MRSRLRLLRFTIAAACWRVTKHSTGSWALSNQSASRFDLIRQYSRLELDVLFLPGGPASGGTSGVPTTPHHAFWHPDRHSFSTSQSGLSRPTEVKANLSLSPMSEPSLCHAPASYASLINRPKAIHPRWTRSGVLLQKNQAPAGLFVAISRSRAALAVDGSECPAGEMVGVSSFAMLSRPGKVTPKKETARQPVRFPVFGGGPYPRLRAGLFYLISGVAPPTNRDLARFQWLDRAGAVATSHRPSRSVNQ